MSSTISNSVVKALALKSGNRCAFPACPQRLSVEGNNVSGFTIIGEIAHIAGEKLGAERYEVSMTDQQRNSLPNLIYLCPTHHTQIDKRGNTYTVQIITQWKLDHEGRIDQAVINALPDVTFAELNIVTKSIAEGDHYIPFDGDFTVTNPADKMERNDLTARSHMMLAMALAAAPQVTNFIKAMSPVVPNFAEKLKTGFQDQYNSLFNAGVRGDELFEGLCVFASKYSSEFPVQAAGLAVIGYLFQVCDVFKK